MADSEALATREMEDGIEKKVGRRGPLYRGIRHCVYVAMFVALPVVGCTSKESYES